MASDTDYAAHCGQCGQPYSARACGPTHALVATEQDAAREAAELLPTVNSAQGAFAINTYVVQRRPAVAARLRELMEAADHVADLLHESDGELSDARERIAALEAERDALAARISACPLCSNLDKESV